MKRLFPPALFVLAWLMNAQGQTVLTLDTCLTLAREHSPLLQRAQNRIRSTTLAHEELLTTRLPQLRLAATPVYAPFGMRFGYDPVLSNGGQIVGQVILQQSLYDGGIRSLKSDQLQIDLERFGKEQRLADRDLVFSVRQAFIQTLRSQKEVVLERESVEQLSDYRNLVKRLYSGGNAGYTDVLKSDLQLSGAKISYQKASDDLMVSKYSLAELVGIAIDTSFTVEGSLDSTQITPDSALAATHPDSTGYLELSIADLEMKSSLLDVQVTQRERWPILSLTADAGYANSGENLDLRPSDRYSAFGFSLGIVLDIPLITWGATDLRVQQKQVTVDNLRLESNLLRRSIASEMKKARLQLIRSRDMLHILRGSVKSAEENFLLTESKFAGGGVLSLEVLSAQQLLTETRLAELRTLADIQLLIAKLEQLTTR